MRKILVSPGYGAGWTSWNTDKIQKFMIEYQPIIDYLEAGNKFTRKDCEPNHHQHPLLTRLQEECLEKFGESYVCVLGAYDLRVVSIPDDAKVRINEYDGYESYEVQGQYDGWL